MAEVARSIFAGGRGRRYELRGRCPGVIGEENRAAVTLD
jgi:hypothetical protein